MARWKVQPIAFCCHLWRVERDDALCVREGITDSSDAIEVFADLWPCQVEHERHINFS